MGFFDDIAGIVSDFNSLKTEAVDAVSQLKTEAIGLKDEAVNTAAQLKTEAVAVKDELVAGVGGVAQDIGLQAPVDDAPAPADGSSADDTTTADAA